MIFNCHHWGIIIVTLQTALLLALGWFLRRPDRTRSAMLAGRLLGGAFAALAAVCLYQAVNNAVFDSLFQP